MYVCMYACLFVSMYVCVYVCMYVCMYYVCMYVCMYVSSYLPVLFGLKVYLLTELPARVFFFFSFKATDSVCRQVRTTQTWFHSTALRRP